MRCPSCGAEIDDRSEFCPQCGASLRTAGAGPVPPQGGQGAAPAGGQAARAGVPQGTWQQASVAATAQRQAMPSVSATPMPPARQGAGLATAALVLSLIAALLIFLGGVTGNAAINAQPYIDATDTPSGVALSIDINLWSLAGMVIPAIPGIALRALGYVVAGLLVWAISRDMRQRPHTAARVAAVVAAVLMLCDAVPYLFNVVLSGQFFFLGLWNDPSMLSIAYGAFVALAVFPGYLVAVPAAVLSIIAALRIKPSAPVRPAA